MVDMDALKCARELYLVKVVAIKVLGKVTEEELSTTLAKRESTKATATVDVGSELSMQENVEHVERVLEDDDMEGVHAHKKRAQKAAGQDIGDQPTCAPPEGGLAKPGDDVASGSTKVSLTGSRTLDAAKKYLPPAPGCTITLDTARHFRWSVRCNRPTPPRTFSLAFGRDERASTMDTSLLACYRWAWSAHKALTGEDCPWGFAD